MKKYKMGSIELFECVVNKQLEQYGVTIHDIRKLPENKINGKDWFQHYTWNSEKDYEAFKKWFFELLEKKVTPKLNKNMITRYWSGFDSDQGLSHNYKE